MLSSLFKLHSVGPLDVLKSSVFFSYKTYDLQEYFVCPSIIQFHLEFLLPLLTRRISGIFGILPLRRSTIHYDRHDK